MMHKPLDRLFLSTREQIDEEEKRIVNTVRQWADREILAKRLAYLEHYENEFAEKRRMLLMDIGLQRLALSEEDGGFGWNSNARAPGLAAVLMEISRADAATAYMSALQFATILVSGADSTSPVGNLISRFYSTDKPVNPALILPGPGSLDKQTPLFFGRSINARLIHEGEGEILTGKNIRPPGCGALADHFCVVCADSAGKPRIAFVSADAQGVQIGNILKETGLNACTNADVTFNHVRLPREAILEGNDIVERLYLLLNLLLGATSVGAAMNFFEIVYDWASTRTIKGGSIMKENPLCASVLADVAEEIAIARFLIDDLARLIAMMAGPHSPELQHIYTMSQIMGYRVQQGTLRAVNRGMELMGSAGYSREWHAEKHWRDIKTIQSYLCGVGAEVPVKMDTARFFFDCREI
ncbi:MAG: acyl-CoA dehydrogenase family protein [Smithellaceae bacterium]